MLRMHFLKYNWRHTKNMAYANIDWGGNWVTAFTGITECHVQNMVDADLHVRARP